VGPHRVQHGCKGGEGGGDWAHPEGRREKLLAWRAATRLARSSSSSSMRECATGCTRAAWTRGCTATLAVPLDRRKPPPLRWALGSDSSKHNTTATEWNARGEGGKDNTLGSRKVGGQYWYCHWLMACTSRTGRLQGLFHCLCRHVVLTWPKATQVGCLLHCRVCTHWQAAAGGVCTQPTCHLGGFYGHHGMSPYWLKPRTTTTWTLAS
jgi:hypothetical protein